MIDRIRPFGGFDYIRTDNPTPFINPGDVGINWLNLTTGRVFICNDATPDDNVWKDMQGNLISKDFKEFSGYTDIVILPEDQVLSSYTTAINLDGSVIALTVYGSDLLGANAGYAVVLRRTNGVWNLEPVSRTVPVAGDYFGSSVIISDDGLHLVIGAYGNFTYTGKIIYFKYVDGVWVETYQLAGNTETDYDAYQLFGLRFSGTGDLSTIVAGGQGNVTYATGGGIAWIISLEGDTLVEKSVVVPPASPPDRHAFGTSCTVFDSGTKVLISSPGASDIGDLYIYTIANNVATYNTVVPRNVAEVNPSATYGGYGTIVAMSFDEVRICVSCPYIDDEHGIIEVYTANNGTFDYDYTISLTSEQMACGADFYSNFFMLGDATDLYCPMKDYTPEGNTVITGVIFHYKLYDNYYELHEIIQPPTDNEEWKPSLAFVSRDTSYGLVAYTKDSTLKAYIYE